MTVNVEFECAIQKSNFTYMKLFYIEARNFFVKHKKSTLLYLLVVNNFCHAFKLFLLSIYLLKNSCFNYIFNFSS